MDPIGKACSVSLWADLDPIYLELVDRLGIESLISGASNIFFEFGV